MFELNNDMLSRFAKDSNIPIHILDDPTFTYLLDLLDPFYQSKTKYARFLDAVKRFNTRDDFFEEFKRIIDVVYDDMYKRGAMDALAEMGGYTPSAFGKNIKNTNLYHKENDGQCFISIDLVEANFQSIYSINPEFLRSAPNYTSYMFQFTDIPYFAKSKYMRNVLFGKIYPQKQISIQRSIMEKIIFHLVDDLKLNIDDIYARSSDEIIIKYYGDGLHIDDRFSREFYDNIGMSLYRFHMDQKHIVRFKLDMFNLYRLNPHNFYLKETFIVDPSRLITRYETPSNISIHNTPAFFIPQIIKHLTGKAINPVDLQFYFENQLCRFMNILNIEMPENLIGRVKCR